MEKLKQASRIGYCTGLIGMVAPQFYYGAFGVNFFPAWPGLAWLPFWAGLFSLMVIAACIAIMLGYKPRTAALLLGVLLLAMYCFGYFPFDLFIQPYNNHLGAWADGLKEPALAGGAFVVAASYPAEVSIEKSGLLKLFDRLAPFGRIFFCITIILYGYAHFLYPTFIAVLVPAWIPGHIFWTYFAGACLMLAGIAIVLKIQLQLAATTLGATIFVWLIILHIPRAVADPSGNHSSEFVAACSAVSFTGIAFLIAVNAGASRLQNAPYSPASGIR